MKLTKARIAMLDQLRREPGPYAESYPPLRALLEAGLARKIVGKTSDSFELTETGRKVCSEVVH